jgi:hypothetical protein
MGQLAKLIAFGVSVFLISVFFAISISAQNVEFLGSYDGLINGMKLFVQGNYAYVSGETEGHGGRLEIIDISNPSNPVFVGRYDLLYSRGLLFVSGDYVYVTDAYTFDIDVYFAVNIINISDPTNPTGVGVYRDFNSWINGLWVLGSYVYSTWYIQMPWYEFRLIDVSDPANPTYGGGINIGQAATLFILGNYAYIGGIDSLCVYDISGQSTPSRVGGMPGWAWGIFASGNYAYVAGDSLQIINISNPLAPALAGHYHASRFYGAIFVSESYAYISNNDSLLILNVSDPPNPIFAGSYPVLPADIYVSGNYIYVTDGSSLQILKFNPTGISEARNPLCNLSLSQNYPNPFNIQTTIQYSLPTQSPVTIDIFDILGRKIETLAEGMKPAGNNRAMWDASNQSSGIYFYRIRAGDKIETRKMVLMK